MVDPQRKFEELSWAEKLKELRDFEERWGSPSRLATEKGQYRGVVKGGVFDGWDIWRVYALRRTLERMN